MNLKFIILPLLLIAVSCEKPNPESQKKNLNGYWEIKTVEMPNGEKKGIQY